jgi:hypothetical protein
MKDDSRGFEGLSSVLGAGYLEPWKEWNMELHNP